jgi:Pentapeptide repeats (8 copies)
VRDAASGKGRKAETTDSKPPSDSEEPQDERWYDRTRYQVLLFVGSIVLFVLVGGLILTWYIEPRTSGQKKDLVQALGLLTAGVAGAVGIFFTWRGQRITQESLQDTRENSEENLRLAREGQITERFTRAIDQLGATDDKGEKKLEIRLGGIYALERIAGDSLAMEDSPGRDYNTVMEVLTAYVRENTTQAPGTSEGSSTVASTSNEPTVQADEGAEQAASREPRRPTADIQAILDVLRRVQASVPEEYRTRLDLREANLQRANLQEAILQDADLGGANLKLAGLRGANLYGAKEPALNM